MKSLILVTFLIAFHPGFCQDKKVIHTDSSRIEIDEVIKGRQSIHEYIKGKNLVKWTFINEDGFIEEKGQYDTLERYIGVWYTYDKNGGLLKTEDFDNRSWSAVNKEYYPYKSLLDGIKKKADNIVIKAYGADFFKTHTKWDFSQCAIYFDDDGGANWTDPTTKKPISFLIRYDILYDSEHLYDDMIEFGLDEKGNFKGDQYEDIYGFEKLPSGSLRIFRLNHAKAIELAIQNGLIETDSTKAEAFLKWENSNTNSFYNGNFRYYVTIKTSSIKNIRPDSRSSITDKFDVYIFNPWTSELVEKKKMKAIRSWEKMSGSSTGLMPDNK